MVLEPTAPPTTPEIPLYGKIIATGVSFDDFMNGYHQQRVEWVEGAVIEMPGISLKHANLSKFLLFFLQAYLEASSGGQVFQDPMLMVLPGGATRAPDLQVILPVHAHRIGQKFILGPADLVVEIVSEGSQNIDRVNKLTEYAKGGVPEYWIIDPIFNEALFYVLTDQREYQRVAPVEGVYTSRALPKLNLPVALLWQDPLPTLAQTTALVADMLKS
jgi:Uma2 family endonuclease